MHSSPAESIATVLEEIEKRGETVEIESGFFGKAASLLRELRDRCNQMHRRAQIAETVAQRVIDGRPQGPKGRSLGRALANLAAAQAEDRAELAEGKVVRLTELVESFVKLGEPDLTKAECDACRAKPGSPTLCSHCYTLRVLIGRAQVELRRRTWRW